MWIVLLDLLFLCAVIVVDIIDNVVSSAGGYVDSRSIPPVIGSFALYEEYIGENLHANVSIVIVIIVVVLRD